jgi:hypothetical protein
MEKKTLLRTTILMLLLTIIILGGCTKGQTFESEVEPNISPGRTGFEITPHTYIVSEYDSNYNTSHYKQVLIDNEEAYTINDTIDIKLLTKFIIENTELFADTLLYSQIVYDTYDLFSIDKKFKIPIIMDQESIDFFLDYNNSHGGYNFLQKTRLETYDEIKRCYYNEAKPYLSQIDWNHCSNLLDYSLDVNIDYDDYILYLENSIADTTADYSQSYADFLSFCLNNARYYKQAGGTYYYGIASDYADAMSYLRLYRALAARCNSCGVLELITHQEHVSQANGGSASSSSIINITEIIATLGGFF